jgi:hypothetical protein
LAALGWAWEISRFGWSNDAAATRLQADVQRRFDSAVRRVEALATRVAEDDVVATELATSPDRSDPLFSRLIALARTSAALDVSATVHTSAGPAGAYRVAAWSDGPAGDLSADQLTGPARLFVARSEPFRSSPTARRWPFGRRMRSSSSLRPATPSSRSRSTRGCWPRAVRPSVAAYSP